jgi:hypothetical protein
MPGTNHARSRASSSTHFSPLSATVAGYVVRGGLTLHHHQPSLQGLAESVPRRSQRSGHRREAHRACRTLRPRERVPYHAPVSNSAALTGEDTALRDAQWRLASRARCASLATRGSISTPTGGHLATGDPVENGPLRHRWRHRLCGRCDRGQRLCSECGPLRRRESVRRAGAAYRVKPRARRLQSVRQARYRDRLRAKFAEQKVTHQTVTEAPSPTTSSSAPDVTAGGKDGDDESNFEVGRCSLCRAALPLWARSGRRSSRAGIRTLPRRSITSGTSKRWGSFPAIVVVAARPSVVFRRGGCP